MQISLHSSLHASGSHPMTEHLQSVVLPALARFGDRVLRVAAHLSDANGAARSGSDDIHCTLEAHLVGSDPVVVKEQGANAHQAIAGAVHKLKRAVGTAIAKHDPRGRRVQPMVAGDPASSEDDA